MENQEQTETILLVEDTEDNRFMMRRLLEMSGYQVVEATNGEEAVRLAQSERLEELLEQDLARVRRRALHAPDVYARLSGSLHTAPPRHDRDRNGR